MQVVWHDRLNQCHEGCVLLSVVQYRLRHTPHHSFLFDLSITHNKARKHTIRSILNTEQAAQILLADRANDVIEGIMAEYVEKDVIKEVSEEEAPKMKIKK